MLRKSHTPSKSVVVGMKKAGISWGCHGVLMIFGVWGGWFGFTVDNGNLMGMILDIVVFEFELD